MRVLFFEISKNKDLKRFKKFETKLNGWEKKINTLGNKLQICKESKQLIKNLNRTHIKITNVSSHVRFIILSKLAKKDIKRLRSSGIKCKKPQLLESKNLKIIYERYPYIYLVANVRL